MFYYLFFIIHIFVLTAVDVCLTSVVDLFSGFVIHKFDRLAVGK